MNARARSEVAGADALEELTLNEAILHVRQGHPVEALAVLEAVGSPTRPRARAMHALAEVPALVGIGRCATAARVAERVAAEWGDLGAQIALPDAVFPVVARVFALADCGQLVAAIALASTAYDATPPGGSSDARLWLASMLGRCALLTGQVETARRWLGEALARCEAHSANAPTRLVLSGLAIAHAYAGDAEASTAAVLELERHPPCPLAPMEQELGRAWAEVASGDLPAARRCLRAGAERAAAEGFLDHRGVAAP